MDVAIKREMPVGVLVVLSLSIAGLILAFDLSFPLGTAAAVPYMVLVLIGLIVHQPRAVFWLAVLGSVLTVVGFLASEGAVTEAVWVNRGVALFAIWTTAVVSYLHLRTLTVLSPLANTDQLTGLFNRHYFAAEAVKQIELWKRHGHPLSLILVDIDHFKRVNDRYGHPAGDEALRRVAEACGNQVRRVDTLARIGGEEFAVLLPSTDLEGAVTTADRMRAEIERLEILYAGETIRLTISVGIVEFRDDSWSITEFMKAADGALYEAKRTGRNRVVVATPRLLNAAA